MIFFFFWVVKCTVQSEIHTAAISHGFIGFAEMEQRVFQINTGMGSLFQLQLLPQLNSFQSFLYRQKAFMGLDCAQTAWRSPTQRQYIYFQNVFFSVTFKETVILTHFLWVYHLQTDIERCAFTFDK